MKSRFSHAELVIRAERWLRNFAGCSTVLTELVANTSYGEIPDAIGWRSGISILVECKTSRQDFLADANKRFRLRPEYGMGRHRFFMCSPGVIRPDDLPRGWGLLTIDGRRVTVEAGNSTNSGWHYAPFKEYNAQAEIAILASALRRVQAHAPQGVLVVREGEASPPNLPHELVA